MHKISARFRGSGFRRFYFLIFVDLQLIFFAYLFSFLLRFDIGISKADFVMFLMTVPVVLLIKIIFYIYFRLNKMVWLYSSLNDLMSIVKASTLSNLIYAFIFYLFFRFEGYPRSVIIIDWALFIGFIGGIRLLYRYYFEARQIPSRTEKRCLIIGAGDASERLMREMLSQKIKYFPAGILDDDSNKWNLFIHGVKVYGPIKDVYHYAKFLNIEEIIIAIPSASNQEMQTIVKYCESCIELNIEYKTLPGLNEILARGKSPTFIREIRLEDLIGRKMVTVDQIKIGQELKNKSILITGAAGSIGSELARQIYAFQPESLVIVDRNENNLLYLEKELETVVPQAQRLSYIADVGDKEKMSRIIGMHAPAYIFHAAAYKHVPYMESNPAEAVLNNIQATYQLAKLAEQFKVQKFVFISTDKAVHPTSVMGCSKRIAELVLLNLFKKSETKFVIVRFGNVIGSEGSVVQIFQRQIKAGGPVTVTHPQMRRFFMTIPEAVRLTLQASYIGEHGNTLILDMGEQISILKVAENLIKLAGFKPYEDIKIEFSGIRPGEKMFEELWGNSELPIPTSHPKINKTFYNISAHEFDPRVLERLIRLSRIHSNAHEIKGIMKQLVPDFVYQEGDTKIQEKISARHLQSIKT